jgi:uncharacterized repeat protein (TIGR01451 family)
MRTETLLTVKPMGGLWATRTLTLLGAALALLASHSALAQGGGFTVGTNLIDISQQKGNETDPFVAINPVNPSNIVVVSASDGTNGGLFFAYTTNMGGIWSSNFIATNSDSQGLNPGGGPYTEPSAAFDAYGNLFLAYLPSNFLGVAIAVSTNGGKTFASLTNLAPLDVTDQPRITAPPVGAAKGSVWVVYKDYTTATTPLQVQGLLSTGLGAIGTFDLAQDVPGSTNGGFADIAVGPFGQVLVAFQDNLDGQPDPFAYPMANIFVSVKTNAVANGMISTNSIFGPAAAAASNAIGGVTYIQAAPTGIGINAAPGLGWDYNASDTNYGRAYLIYTAVGTNVIAQGPAAVIGFCYATNFGTNASVGAATWSQETVVDDDYYSGDTNGGFNDHFLPHMSVEPVKGVIVCSWYDCRNDQGANSPVITNMVTTNFTFTASMVTNISITGPIVSSNVTIQGGNVNVTIVADNLASTLMTSDLESNVFVDNSNIDVIILTATNTGTTKVTVTLVNLITTAYTTGNGSDKAAVMYETISVNDGLSFEPNQQLMPANQNVVPPATGVASSIAGSDSLTGWGHYTGLAAYGANFFPAWADSSDVAGPTNNPDGANTNFDIYMINSAPGKGGDGLPSANLTIFVTNTPNPVISEEVITYSVIVSNRGPMGAAPVIITNILSPYVTLLQNTVTPALSGTYVISQLTNGLTQIVFTFPMVAINAVLTNTFRVSATVSSIATNFASVFSPLPNFLPTNAVVTNQVIVIEGEDLAMGMTASETNVLIGDTVVSWVTVTNLGPATNGPVFITNSFSTNWTNVTVTPQTQGTNQVTNSSSGQIAIVNLGLLPVGQPVTATFTAVALTGSTFASESAFVVSQDVDTNLANNSSSLSYYVNDETLAIEMTSSTNSVDLGQPVNFTITVTNYGLSYSGEITVVSALSTNLGQLNVTQSQGSDNIVPNVNGFNQVVLSLGTLGAGETATMNISAIGLSGPTAATNIATVSSTDFDTNLTDTVVTNLLTINGEELAIGVTASPANPEVGQTVTFSESVTNLGLSSNGVVMVTNTFTTNLGSIAVLQPATGYTINGNVVTFNLGTLNPGQSVPLTLTAIATSAGTGKDTAKVGSRDFDTNTALATAAVTVTITLPVITNLVVTPMASSAFIVFDTSAVATAQAQYGLTTGYGNITTLSTTPTTHHVILLTGLQAGTNYDFKVQAFVGITTLTAVGSFSTTNTLILNTPDARYSGVWTEGTVATGIFGAYYQYSTTTVFDPTANAVYDPFIPASGLYDVSIWYPANATFTTNAQVYVNGATNDFIIPVNETANGGAWQPLATNMYFVRGTNGTVILYNDTGDTNKYIVANAMMWSYTSAQDYPTNGSVPAWWANFYFGTNVNGYVNGTNIAANGYSMYANYVFGTDPTDPASGLSFTVSPVSSNADAITFTPCQGGRSYQLQTASDLSNPVWTTLTNGFTLSTAGTGTFTIASTNPPAAFYRLSAYILPSP